MCIGSNWCGVNTVLSSLIPSELPQQDGELVDAYHPTPHISDITCSLGDDFYRPNDTTNSTEGSQLATENEIGFNLTRTTPLCYNMNSRQPLLS